MVAACAARSNELVAAAAEHPIDAFTLEWLTGHEPSSLDVSGFALSEVRRSDPDATVRRTSFAPRAACLQAKRDHALLLIFAPVGQAVRRAAALDCGFALWRDDSGVIVAPR